MSIIEDNKEVYAKRRQVMRDNLAHGDINKLSTLLLAAYPNITRSPVKDFANYLSQVFNKNSKRPFKSSLASKIESVWPSLAINEVLHPDSEQSSPPLEREQENDPDASQQSLYRQRRENVRVKLSHGDIRLLAGRLLKKYPDSTKSNLKGYGKGGMQR
mgnify:CR=1 FL=1